MEMMQELEEMWWINQNAQEISQLLFSPNKHEHMFQSFSVLNIHILGYFYVLSHMFGNDVGEGWETWIG